MTKHSMERRSLKIWFTHMFSHYTPCPLTTTIDKLYLYRFYPYTIFIGMDSNVRRNLTLQSSINILKGRVVIDMEYELNTPQTTNTKFGQLFFHIKIPHVIKTEVMCYIACPKKQWEISVPEFGGGLHSIQIVKGDNGERSLEKVS